MLLQNFSNLKTELRDLRSALWVRPTLFCVASALLAGFIGTVDSFVPKEFLNLLPSAELQTAKELLVFLASGMLTVTTVSLSVIIVVLSITSGQASPRAIPEIIADSVTQNALGSFLAAFVFSLSALLLFGFGMIDEGGMSLVFVATLVFVVNSLRYLVQWIHHIADSLKLNRIVQRIFDQALRVLEAYLKRTESSARHSSFSTFDNALRIYPDASGYIQLIDKPALASLAEDSGISIRLLLREGAFVHPRLPLMLVEGVEEDETETIESLRSTVVTGSERSPEGDPLLGFELLAEIACRALSSGINDPQTAITAIHYNGSLLAAAAAVAPEDYPREHFAHDRVELVQPRFVNMLERAFRPIVRDGAGFVEVLCTILDVLANLSENCAIAYLKEIEEEASRVLSYGLQNLTLEQDEAELRGAADRVFQVAAKRQDHTGVGPKPG